MSPTGKKQSGTGRVEMREFLRPDDETALLELLRDTGFFSPEEVLVAGELILEALSKGPDSGYHFLVLEIDGVPAGFACHGPVPASRCSYDLYWIAVHPRHQGRGLGAKLLGRVEELIAAQGGERVYIETSSQSQYRPTQGFYISRGYQLEATLKDFYARGDNKQIYSKELSKAPQD